MLGVSGKIYAPLTTTEVPGDPNNTANKYGDISRTESDDGLKIGIDIAIIRDDTASTAIKLALMALEVALDGTLPRSVYDSYATTLSGTTYTFTFRYSSVRQFVVTVTDPTGLPATSIEEINNLLLEAGSGSIILEDGFELILEG